LELVVSRGWRELSAWCDARFGMRLVMVFAAVSGLLCLARLAH
jgi:hypothetical protein